MIRFWAALVVATAATLMALAAAGVVVANVLVHPPDERLMTAAFEMNIAKGWSCYRDGPAYDCDPPGKPPFDAVVIIVMKYRGPDDTLDAYQTQIGTARPASGSDGTQSTVAYVRRRTIGSHEWVEGQQSDSELAGYVTYYLATVTSDVGVLVTLSADKGTFAQRQQELDGMIASLDIYQTPAGLPGDPS